MLCRSVQCLCAVRVEFSKLVLCCLQFGLQTLGVPGHMEGGGAPCADLDNAGNLPPLDILLIRS